MRTKPTRATGEHKMDKAFAKALEMVIAVVFITAVFAAGVTAGHFHGKAETLEHFVTGTQIGISPLFDGGK